MNQWVMLWFALFTHSKWPGSYCDSFIILEGGILSLRLHDPLLPKSGRSNHPEGNETLKKWPELGKGRIGRWRVRDAKKSTVMAVEKLKTTLSQDTVDWT